MIARSRSPYAPISYAMFKGRDLHTTIPCAAYDRGLCARDTDCRAVVGVQSVRWVFDAGRGHLQVWPSHSRSRNFNCNYDGKRHKFDRKITEEKLRRGSEQQQEVDDELSSFEEVEVARQRGEVWNPRFMTEARRKELGRRGRCRC